MQHLFKHLFARHSPDQESGGVKRVVPSRPKNVLREKRLEFRSPDRLNGGMLTTTVPKRGVSQSQPGIQLPPSLISPETLAALRADLTAIDPDRVRRPNEPHWQALPAELSKRHNLDHDAARQLARALERLWLLPFQRYETCRPLLLFGFLQLPSHAERIRKKRDADGAILVRAFEILIEVMLQGKFAFPGDPVHLAGQVKSAIISRSASSRTNLLPLLRLLVSESDPDGHCGFNHYRCEDPNELALHEHKSRRGIYEGVLKRTGQLKMRAYERQLSKTPAFWREWRDLKRAFGRVDFVDARGIVRRSPIPERNWRRESPPQFKNPREAFQAAFDIFCWKWFLYGMENDKPLVHKPFYTFTPYGTQLFIPGYLSLDPHRDVDFPEFNRLHQARGVRRQGEKLGRNREERAAWIRRLRKANQEAMRDGLRGDKRWQHLKKAAGLHEQVTDNYIQKLLRTKWVK